MTNQLSSSRGASTPLPTRSSSRAFLVTLIVAVLISGGLAAYLFSGRSYDLATPEGAAAKFVDSVNAQDLAAVRDTLCRADRSQTDGQSSMPGISLELGSVTQQSSERATAEVRMSAMGRSMSESLPLTYDGERWYVCRSSEDSG